jgi:hypothetical protein
MATQWLNPKEPRKACTLPSGTTIQKRFCRPGLSTEQLQKTVQGIRQGQAKHYHLNPHSLVPSQDELRAFRRISGSCGNATIFAKCSGISINSQVIPASQNTPNPDTVINATIGIIVWLALKNSTILMTVSAPPTNITIAKIALAILIARPPSVGYVRRESAQVSKGLVRTVPGLCAVV